VIALLRCGHWTNTGRAGIGGTVEWCERCESAEIIDGWAITEDEDDSCGCEAHG